MSYRHVIGIPNEYNEKRLARGLILLIPYIYFSLFLLISALCRVHGEISWEKLKNVEDWINTKDLNTVKDKQKQDY